MALGLGEPTKLAKYKRKTMAATSQATKDAKKGTNGADDELIFSLEEEQMSDLTQTQSLTFPSVTNHSFVQTNSLKLKSKSPTRSRFNAVRLSKHVSIIKLI